MSLGWNLPAMELHLTREKNKLPASKKETLAKGNNHYPRFGQDWESL